MSNLPATDMNYYTLVHVAMRAIYNYLYVTTKTRRSSYLRTAVFQFSAYPAVAIFCRAALALA